MITSVFFVFALVMLTSFFPIKVRGIRNFLLLAFTVWLFLLAGLRDDNVAADYSVYMSFWNLRELQGIVEVSFIWIRDFLKYKLDLQPIYLFVVYAVLGVSSKIYAISKTSAFPFLSVLIYISHYFILHELVQVRIGVAAGFFLIALYYKTRENLYYTLIFILIAFFFHYSAAVGLLILFINNKHSKLYYFLIPAGYVFYFLNSKLNISIPIPYVQQKLDTYQEMKKWGIGDEINVFNFVFLIRILILYFLFYKAKTISIKFTSVNLFIKVYAISLFSFLFLSDNPAFSFRIQEFLGVVEIMLIPLLGYAYRNKLFSKLIVVIIAIAFISIDVFYIKYIFK